VKVFKNYLKSPVEAELCLYPGDKTAEAWR